MDKLEYRVGRFTLQPFRQLLENGAPVSLGRKALDLLSVLAKAEGALVTKDELMEAVWPNAIVEENAIQVHIAALRKVLGGDAELLTTMRGLGYRLAATETGATPEPSAPRPEPDAPAPPTPATRGRRRFPWALSAGLVAGVLAVVLVVILLPLNRERDWPQIDRRSASAQVPTIAVLSFQPANGSNEAKLFADGLASSIADALGRYNVTVIAPSSSLQLTPAQKNRAGPLLGADFIVDGRIQRNSDKLTVSSQISDTRKNLLVYSYEAQLDSTLSTVLATQIATHLALALDPRKFSTTLGKNFTADDYVLMARANAAIENWDILNVADLSAQLAERHPDDAELQASAGISIIFGLPNLPESQRHQSLQTARAYIDRAVQLGPPSGNVYYGQAALIQGPMTLAAQEAMLQKSLELSPNLPQTYDGLADLMMLVGRIDDAVSFYQRSVQTNPLSVIHAANALNNCLAAGRVAEATQLMEQGKLLWPDQPVFIYAKLGIAAAAGKPEEFLALEKQFPVPWDQMKIKKEDFDLMLQAAITKDPDLIRRVIDNCFRDYEKGVPQTDDEGCLGMMVRVGALDDAFRFAELAYPDNRMLYPKDDDRWLTKPLPGLSTIRLFPPFMASFRDDPRFWPVAVRTGLVNYWQTTDQWPDFCRDQLDTCKARAAEGVRNSTVVRAAIQQ